MVADLARLQLTDSNERILTSRRLFAPRVLTANNRLINTVSDPSLSVGFNTNRKLAEAYEARKV